MKQDKGDTVIYANFGGANPNNGLAEVTMRKSVFRPIVDGGVNYITLRGFHMSHAAPNWSPPSPKTSDQEGLITTYRGGRWIIERNIISDSRTVGIVSGSLQNNNQGNYDTMGHHIVRGNVIRNCGQSGICGRTGWAVSLIEGNLIEEINPLMEFGGWETAGIKIHASSDYTIKNNVIRNVYGKGNGVHHGIWIDWANQNIRITGNIIYNTAQTALYFEKNVGGHLVDNNVIVGKGVKEQAHQILLVHNLMIDAGTSLGNDGRRAQYWKPHSYNKLGEWTMETGADRFYNNIYVGVGPGGKQTEHPKAADFNVYYKGAKKAAFEGAQSRVVSDFDPGFTLKSLPDGAEITFAVDADFPGVTAPVVTSAMLGTNFLTGVGMEHPDGTPMDVTTDLYGTTRGKNPTPGPFEKLTIGTNTFRLTVGLAYREK
ncbi:MAG: right-handed parallel beta-helix repeat-containing protein [Lentisphaerae bacterium]|nr:right-handed parallel beta-helix repeat-containing protein [Lentisphaerota bacterium]